MSCPLLAAWAISLLAASSQALLIHSNQFPPSTSPPLKFIFSDPSNKTILPETSKGPEASRHRAVVIIENRTQLSQVRPGSGLPQLQRQSASMGNNEFDVIKKSQTSPASSISSSKNSGVVFVQNVPENAREEYGKALKMLRRHKEEEALTALDKAIEIYPNYYSALETLGALEMERGNMDNSLTHLNQATRVNPKGSGPYYWLGILHMNLNRLKAAIGFFKTSVELDPRCSPSQLALGYSYFKAGALMDAEDHLELAYQLDRDSAINSQIYLASIYERSGRFGDAAAALRTYMKHAPSGTDKAAYKKMAEALEAKALQGTTASTPKTPTADHP